MRLLLARHGESTWNVEGRYQGRRDAPLSPRGVAQARALAAHLAGLRAADMPKAIVSSPLQRARDTAMPAAQALGLDVSIDERLIEISHGEWEGLLKSEIAERWPAMYAAWRTAPDTVVFPGGESLDEVRARWRAFCGHASSMPAPLLVVTHDVIVRVAVLDARREPLRAFNAVIARNASIAQFSLSSGALALESLNEDAYLGDLRVDPAGQAL